MMKFSTSLFAFLLFVGTAAAAQEIPTFQKLIEKQGKAGFSDGSSYYQFDKDGTFVLEPVGMSGRTVRGFWKSLQEGHFIITGKWEWVNGISANNDFRKMVLNIVLHSDQPQKTSDRETSTGAKIYPVYFTVEELSKISLEEYNNQSKSKKNAPANDAKPPR